MKKERLHDLTKYLSKLDLKIKNLELFNIALTHGSYLKEHEELSLEDNERLEFFGDAVLKMYISEYLMSKYPSYSEGELSNLRAFVVSEKVLTKVANKLVLNKYLLVSKSIKSNIPDSVLANALEAILAVIYYECGSDTAKAFILDNWLEYIEYANKDKEKENYKAVLQEHTQGNKLGLPIYKTIDEMGPDHNKEFEVAVFLLNKEVARGKGKNKKEASQKAAQNAYKILRPVK